MDTNNHYLNLKEIYIPEDSQVTVYTPATRTPYKQNFGMNPRDENKS